MRITITIDDDVLDAARSLAQRQHKTLGQIISALARGSLHQPAATHAMRNGVPLLSRGSAVPTVTLEMVNELRDGGS